MSASLLSAAASCSIDGPLGLPYGVMLKGWLDQARYAIFDGHVIELFADSRDIASRRVPVPMLTQFELESDRGGNVSLNMTTRNGRPPAVPVHASCVPFAQHLAQAVKAAMAAPSG